MIRMTYITAANARALVNPGSTPQLTTAPLTRATKKLCKARGQTFPGGTYNVIIVKQEKIAYDPALMQLRFMFLVKQSCITIF